MKKRRLLYAAFAVSITLLFDGFVTRVNDDYIEIVKNLEIFGKLYKEVNSLYVDETDPSLLMRTGIDAMLATLDPYTNFIDEGQADEIEFMSTGQYAGIGFNLADHGGNKTVTEVLSGSPSDLAGIRIGDVIETLNGAPLLGSLDSIHATMKGPSGSRMELMIRKPDGTRVKTSVQRAWVRVPNVPFYGIVGGKIGYVALRSFSMGAAEEVRQALSALATTYGPLDGLILDLRGNPGGRLDEAVKVANVFLPPQETIVETRGRVEGARQVLQTTRAAAAPELPLTVLINAQSASAAEIVAGALQDLDRALILGGQSFGKGLVQNIRPLSYDTQLKITTAKYYTPSGRCIQSVSYHNNPAVAAHQEEAMRGQYFTRNRRPVSGGGGILPDVSLPEEPASELLKALGEKRLIFDFVTNFRLQNPAMPISPDSFEPGPEVFESFKRFLKSKNFTYESALDLQLQRIQEAAKEEAYLTNLQSDFDELAKEIASNKSAEMERLAPSILRAIRLEMVRRQFYDAGYIASALRDDPVVSAARTHLADLRTFRQLLAPAP